MNCTRAPFADKRVRQAFLAAVDPTVMQKIGFFDTGRVSHGPLSPAFDTAAAAGIAHDPAHSKALLQQAGVASPLPVTITVTNSPQLVRIAQILQAQAGQAGFHVEVKQIDPTSLITVLRQRDFDLCMAPGRAGTIRMVAVDPVSGLCLPPVRCKDELMVTSAST